MKESDRAISVEELCADHPELIGAVRHQIRLLEAVNGLLEPMLRGNSGQLKCEFGGSHSPGLFAPEPTVSCSNHDDRG